MLLGFNPKLMGMHIPSVVSVAVSIVVVVIAIIVVVVVIVAVPAVSFIND